MRVLNDDWKVIYNLNERWMKNNRDSENIVYESRSLCFCMRTDNYSLKKYKCFTNHHEKLLHNDIQFLLIMTFADEALYDIKSFEDL